MKALLAVLLVFVLLESQALAFHQPHPGEGGGFTGTVNGTFAGVMIPTTSDSSSSTDESSFNSIGIFVLAVPASGEAQGTFFTFSSGAFYNGVIVGIADPDTGHVSAVVQGVHTITENVVSSGSVTSVIVVDAENSGVLQAQITTDLTGNTPERLTGLAETTLTIQRDDSFTADLVNNQQVNFAVDGFLQTTDTTIPTTTVTLQ